MMRYLRFLLLMVLALASRSGAALVSWWSAAKWYR
jgi:hypothetical protein